MLNNDLRRVFYLYLSYFLLFCGSETKVLSSLQVNNENKIGVEYLKQLPQSDYIIGPGDNLFIAVSSEIPELAVEINVDGEGTIYVPRLNRLYVEGLTINELTSLLNQSYKTFIKRPSVQVIVQEYRPIRILIEGEVQNPGWKNLKGAFSLDEEKQNKLINYKKDAESSELSRRKQFFSIDQKESKEPSKRRYYFPRVFDALQESGGITEFSDLSNIQIIRKNNLSNGGGEITTTLNFEKLMAGDSTQNIRIYDKDIIRVKKSYKANNLTLAKAISSELNPKLIEVFVTGRVRAPGPKIVSRASVLTDAVDIAGGAKAMRGPTTFIRFNNDGTVDKRRFRFRRTLKRGTFKNPLLQNGDLIVIGDSAFTNANEVVQEFTSPFIGIFSTYGIIKALSD
ncbi:polysaccharide biosynthesis/export family protein [Prochlorococcus sp. AH-736-L15]|nr:polysaccharide biosynthesis/export family protein [Prochlorococcus sp. AH-736-L15]MDA9741380.1 polysaccharide biosynthesis/export family protein [Prochlorococcus sp. AH-736-L15]